MYKIVPMTMEMVNDISNWKYEGEYSIYSFEPDEELTAELMDGSYHACVDGGELVGYFCFGFSARIPLGNEEKEVYLEDRLDIGLGLRPDLCGKGNGDKFMQAGLEFAETELDRKDLRLVVAAFNKRAIRLYEKMGFVKQKEVRHLRSGEPFYIMTCDR